MAAPITPKVEALERLGTDLRIALAQHGEQLAHLREEVRRLRDEIAPISRDWSNFQNRLEVLEKTGDQWTTRAWGIVEKLLIAAVAAALGYYLKR